MDGFLEVINGYLVVFEDTSNDELVDTVCDGFLLVVFLPDEAVHGDCADLEEEGVEVGFSFVGLDVEKEEGLGDRANLLFLGFFLLLLFSLNKSLSFLIIINKTLLNSYLIIAIVSERIEIIFISSLFLGFFLLDFLFSSLLVTSLGSSSSGGGPRSSNGLVESLDKDEPGEGVGVALSGGRAGLHLIESFSVGIAWLLSTREVIQRQALTHR